MTRAKYVPEGCGQTIAMQSHREASLGNAVRVLFLATRWVAPLS